MSSGIVEYLLCKSSTSRAKASSSMSKALISIIASSLLVMLNDDDFAFRTQISIAVYQVPVDRISVYRWKVESVATRNSVPSPERPESGVPTSGRPQSPVRQSDSQTDDSRQTRDNERRKGAECCYVLRRHSAITVYYYHSLLWRQT